MAKKSSFRPTPRPALPLSGSFASSIVWLDPYGIVWSFALIATAIRQWAFLDWRKNSSFLSPKTILV